MSIPPEPASLPDVAAPRALRRRPLPRPGRPDWLSLQVLRTLADVTSVTDPDSSQVVHTVHGELFFASSNDLVHRFDCAGELAGSHR